MDFQEFKQAIITRCAELGIAEYELYYEHSESTCVGAFQQEINQFTGSVDGGVCFRCIVNGKMGYASTQILDREAAAQLVSRAVDNASVLETEEQVFLGEGGQNYEKLELAPYELPRTEELIDKVLATQRAVYATDSRVVDGGTTQGIAERSEIGIYNSKGLDLSYVNCVAGLIVSAIVSDGEQMANDLQLKLSELSAIDEGELAQKAVSGALEKMGGDAVPTGVYPVIFDPNAMSALLQTFSGVFSAKAAQKGLSQYAKAEGTVIASEAVTIIDDPFHSGNPMPIHFDAEGSPTRCKAVVEKGVLNTLLYDLKTAAVAGKKTTGNASKGSYKSTVGVRPFTMYIAPSELSEEELLRRAGKGVYIDSLEGLHAGANPVSGDFSLQSAGYLIEDGKKTDRVKSFTVAGNFYDLLRKITAVANNMELPKAMGMTAFGAPSVLVNELSVSGK